jgi:HSP20 family protein
MNECTDFPVRRIGGTRHDHCENCDHQEKPTWSFGTFLLQDQTHELWQVVKKSDWPSLAPGSWLSDLFDNDRFLDSDWLRRSSVPAVNVKETGNGYEIEVAAPGLGKEDFDISIEKKVLTISSEKNDQRQEKENGYTRREFSYSSFCRSFALPEEVNEEEVKANYADGVLRINLTKLPEKQQRRKAIEVH